MWDKIKKAINSNLSKPLDTFMTEQFNSWATQRNRLDAAISTRATNDGVWSTTGERIISKIIPSDNILISNTAEYSRTIDTTTRLDVLNFNVHTGGTFRIKVSIKATGSASFGSGWGKIYLSINGVETSRDPIESANITGTYSDRNYEIYIPSEASCKIQISAPHASNSYVTYFKNFRVCASSTNNIVTKL